MMQTWEKAQVYEKNWHNKCLNKVLGEFHQMNVIAPKMGLSVYRDNKDQILIDMKGKSVLDIGGGAASILLKCINVKGKVIDPIKFPDWVYARYDCAGIEWEIKKGEDIDEKGWDECFLYNCLQHCENPKKIVDNARKAAKIIRIYEYINIPVCPGHIHTLREAELNQWLGGEGKTENGNRYFGVFPSNVNTAYHWDSIYRKEGKNTWRVKKELNNYVLSEVEGSVLELGCGVGVLAREIKGDYLGLDISPEAVRIMQEQGFKAEVREIPPINAKADTIVGLEILEHIDNRMETIKEVARSCKKAIFSVPNNCMSPSGVNEHRIMYDQQSFVKFLGQVFSKVKIKVINKYLVAVCQ